MKVCDPEACQPKLAAHIPVLKPFQYSNSLRFASGSCLRVLPMTDHLKSAPVAYENPAFLNSPDGRILRILAEYQEPLARFRREQIQDTVVFFGSARFHGADAAQKSLAAVEKNSKAPAAQQETDVKR